MWRRRRIAHGLVTVGLGAGVMACGDEGASATAVDVEAVDGGASRAPADPALRNYPGFDAALQSGLDYLEATDAEMGLDVLMMLQIVDAEVGSERSRQIAETRVADLRADDLERWGALLELDKPVLAASSLDGVDPSPTTPDPTMRLSSVEDGRHVINHCLQQVLACEHDAVCDAFVAADHDWGYALTHQALWVAIHEWVGCDLPVDIDERRHHFGANLVAEQQFNPDFHDLAGERLALLGHLGFASSIDPEWVQTALDTQQDDARGTEGRCWSVAAGTGCHPHPTGLALWALALVRERGVWPVPAP